MSACREPGDTEAHTAWLVHTHWVCSPSIPTWAIPSALRCCLAPVSGLPAGGGNYIPRSLVFQPFVAAAKVGPSGVTPICVLRAIYQPQGDRKHPLLLCFGSYLSPSLLGGNCIGRSQVQGVRRRASEPVVCLRTQTSTSTAVLLVYRPRQPCGRERVWCLLSLQRPSQCILQPHNQTSSNHNHRTYLCIVEHLDGKAAGVLALAVLHRSSGETLRRALSL